MNGKGKATSSNDSISLVQGTILFIAANEEVVFHSDENLLLYCGRTQQ